MIDPLVFQWQGTRDVSAFLAVPAAIEFQAANQWDEVRQQCHALVVETRQRIADLTGLPPICPDDWFVQMFSAPLPPCNPDDLKRRLYEEHRVEAPLITWNGRHFIRISVQSYNTRQDADRLLAGLEHLLPEVRV